MKRKDMVGSSFAQSFVASAWPRIDDIALARAITTHTLERWLRQAKKVKNYKDADHLERDGYSLACDILRVLEPKKGAK